MVLVASEGFALSLIFAFLGIIAIGIILRLLRQPHVITYILAGVLLGPFSLGLVKDYEMIASFGEIGIILLLFFAGSEISVRKLARNLKIPLFGTLLQVGVSVIFATLLGIFLKWSPAKIVLFGFIISLSSTAVVLRLLDEWGELDTKVGQTVLGVLLVQDVIIVPMIVIIGLFAGNFETGTLALQAAGSVLVALFVYWLFRAEKIAFPFRDLIKRDDELQVFVAIVLCLGFSQLTAFFKLSSALGAFLAGLFVASIEETSIVHKIMHPFRVIFVGAFFVSVGLIINPFFVLENLGKIVPVVLFVFLINTAINSGILLYLGNRFKESVYAGALLSQIGEFSFVLAGTGLSLAIIDSESHDFLMSVIALTLLATPFFIYAIKRIFGITGQNYNFEASHP